MQKIMWKQCGRFYNKKKPEDFVISTGKQYSVKQFVNMVAKELKMKIKWKGKNINEKGYDENNKPIIECEKKYYRASEVDTLKGDYSKARRILKWKPKITVIQLVKEMVNTELKSLYLGND